MSKRAEDYIPKDIREAAESAGLDVPQWYVGRTNGHEQKRLAHGLGKVVDDARAEAHLEEAELSGTPAVDHDENDDDES